MLKGKKALVTGSTSGIGLSVAKSLAEQGCDIILNGFGDAEVIEALRTQMATDYKVDVSFEGVDLTDVSQMEAMAARLQAKGGVDILVNNAGVQFVNPIETFPVAKWDLIIALSLSAPFHLTRLLLPVMRQKKWGRIVNIASAHALVASPFKSAYVSAKHGLAGLTKVVALEAAEDGVTCNAICPGYVHTPLVDAQIDDTAKARGITREAVIRDVMLGPQATKKFVRTDEIGGFVVFLCSASADSITGAVMPIDGAWTAQ
ncbi:MAG: 3-hydroxybutyrate dehydrogenase [Alphaproteobacteria bacterium]|nr:3-hydroxybutyrate dehydrogenase [Alphaproteobacteria bacterium]